MRTKLSPLVFLPFVVAGVFLAGAVVRSDVSQAHECWDESNPPPDAPQEGEELPEGYWRDGDQVCRDTTVMPNWRDNYVPLFDLEDRDDEQQRKDAQRWREECNPRLNEYHSSCAWSYGGFSVVENRDDPTRAPNEWHAGFGATHCFAFELFHQCEDHGIEHGEGVHDAHGGAIFVDLCLVLNPESKYCDNGLTDTQAGIVIMDHNPCGIFVPIASCTDEYHVVRPFDQGYTAQQMENTQESTALIVDDPARYVCGHHESGQDCRDQLQAVNNVTGAVPLL